mgnify:CR=1 FL=1
MILCNAKREPRLFQNSFECAYVVSIDVEAGSTLLPKNAVLNVPIYMVQYHGKPDNETKDLSCLSCCFPINNKTGLWRSLHKGSRPAAYIKFEDYGRNNTWRRWAYAYQQSIIAHHKRILT